MQRWVISVTFKHKWLKSCWKRAVAIFSGQLYTWFPERCAGMCNKMINLERRADAAAAWYYVIRRHQTTNQEDYQVIHRVVEEHPNHFTATEFMILSLESCVIPKKNSTFRLNSAHLHKREPPTNFCLRDRRVLRFVVRNAWHRGTPAR